MNDYKHDPPNLLPASATTPPVQFFYASSPRSARTPIDSGSLAYGPAITFMLTTLRHIAHSDHTLTGYWARLHELIASDIDTRLTWQTSPFRNGGNFGGPWKTQIQDYILARQQDGVPIIAPLSIVITKLSLADQGVRGMLGKESDTKELYVSEDLIKVFVQTQRGTPYDRFPVSPDRYQEVKRCAQHLLLVTIFRELGHALTKHFFGVDYLCPMLHSMPPIGSLSAFELAIETTVLGGICVVEWVDDSFQTAQTDEERLWKMNRLLCRTPCRGGWKTAETEPEQFDLLAESLTGPNIFSFLISKESKNIEREDTTRAMPSMGVLVEDPITLAEPLKRGPHLEFDPRYDLREVKTCRVGFVDEDGNDCSRYA